MRQTRTGAQAIRQWREARSRFTLESLSTEARRDALPKVQIGEAWMRILVLPTYSRTPELKTTPLADVLELYVPNGDLQCSADPERVARYIDRHGLTPVLP